MAKQQEESEQMIQVEVAYATPERQMIDALEVPAGTTAYEAVLTSRILKEFPAIDVENDPMGIYSERLDGKKLPLPSEYVLQAKDRVEIYRPLLVDPKQARLARAEKKRTDAEKARAAQQDQVAGDSLEK